MKHKLALNGPEISAACPILKQVIKKNMILPILEDVLLIAKDGKVTMTATDLETSVIIQMNFAEFESDFSAAIPIVDLAAIKSKDVVILEYDPETFTMEARQGGITSRITCEQSDDFPRIPTSDNAVGLLVSDRAGAFTDAVRFAGKDDMRPQMTGVCLEIEKGKKARIISTDAHRLYTYDGTGQFEVRDTDKRIEVIIPKRPISMLAILEVFDISVVAATREAEGKKKGKQAKMETYYPNVIICGTIAAKKGLQRTVVTIIARTIDAKYPNYKAVIPKQNPVTVKLGDVQTFGNILASAVATANKTTHQVNFSLNGEVSLSAFDLDFSKEMHAVIPGAKVKKPTEDVVEIGFNGEFIQDNLKVLGDKPEFVMSVPSRASIWKGADKRVSVLLMPVMINK